MTSVTVFKDATGKLAGFGDKGGRAFAKFLRTVKAMEQGETLSFSFKVPRSPKHHKFLFWKLRGLFVRQEKFADEARLREWLILGAGYCNLMPGNDGALVPIPQSLSFDDMDEAQFIEFTRCLNDFCWTERAQVTLWPHLDSAQRHDVVDGWHREFDKT